MKYTHEDINDSAFNGYYKQAFDQFDTLNEVEKDNFLIECDNLRLMRYLFQRTLDKMEQLS